MVDLVRVVGTGIGEGFLGCGGDVSGGDGGAPEPYKELGILEGEEKGIEDESHTEVGRGLKEEEEEEVGVDDLGVLESGGEGDGVGMEAMEECRLEEKEEEDEGKEERGCEERE